MALDWTTAEGYTGLLSRDDTSRLSAIPRDVVDNIAPYLHTHAFDGLSYRDGKIHGTQVYISPKYVGVYGMCDGELHGACKWWWADGSMYSYSEWDTWRLLFGIEWRDRIFVYDDGEWTQHDTLPDKYRWVWASMTQTI